MEWVETTAKTIEAAREAALDQLGVGADESEFDLIQYPRPRLFGLVRGEAGPGTSAPHERQHRCVNY